MAAFRQILLLLHVIISTECFWFQPKIVLDYQPWPWFYSFSYPQSTYKIYTYKNLASLQNQEQEKQNTPQVIRLYKIPYDNIVTYKSLIQDEEPESIILRRITVRRTPGSYEKTYYPWFNFEKMLKWTNVPDKVLEDDVKQVKKYDINTHKNDSNKDNNDSNQKNDAKGRDDSNQNSDNGDHSSGVNDNNGVVNDTKNKINDNTPNINNDFIDKSGHINDNDDYKNGIINNLMIHDKFSNVDENKGTRKPYISHYVPNFNDDEEIIIDPRRDEAPIKKIKKLEKQELASDP